MSCVHCGIQEATIATLRATLATEQQARAAAEAEVAVLRERLDTLARLGVLPHPMTYAENDTDQGRSCMRCGLPVPGGFKHAHVVWCEDHQATAHGGLEG